MLAVISGLGFFFLFLPSLPLFFVGLRGKHRIALLSSIIASLLIGLFTGLEVASIFLLLVGLPAWYIAKKSLISANDGEQIYWFPVGQIFIQLIICACLLIAAMTLYYTSAEGGITAVLSTHIREEFSHLEAQYGDALIAIAEHWTFVIFAMTVWLWALALYAHVWCANKLLAHKEKTIRPHFIIQPFLPPNWLLGLMAICGLASLIGSESMQFLAKSSLVSLLFVYFILGCGIMHAASQKWPSPRFSLFFIYFMIFVFMWPAFIIAGVGLVHHIKGLSGSSGSTTS